MKKLGKKTTKAQLKIQEMAFVLMGIVIFFGMAALIYFSISFSGLKKDVQMQREEEAMELTRRLASVPEFSWAGCTGCIDADKVLALKERKNYTRFWNLDYLMIEKIYPNKTKIECVRGNYPECTTFTIIKTRDDYGTPATAFAALCRYEPAGGGYIKCELGRIHASAKATT
ncbi:MAG: hypothetical protein QXD13_00755 [Candidatus Pacearchaeota archaeon]